MGRRTNRATANQHRTSGKARSAPAQSDDRDLDKLSHSERIVIRGAITFVRGREEVRSLRRLRRSSLLPMILRQDPRFFRMEGGSVGSRAMYAATRVFVAHTDSGHNTLNTSLLVGTALSTALANVYYPDRNRNGANTAIRYGIDIEINMTVNVVREFWKLHR